MATHTQWKHFPLIHAWPDSHANTLPFACRGANVKIQSLLSLSGNTLDKIFIEKHPSLCVCVCTDTHTLKKKTHHTFHTHAVNLTPCSNAERIVPGLEDIKSEDYPIELYSIPLTHTTTPPLPATPLPSPKISGINHCSTSWETGSLVFLYVKVCRCTGLERGLNYGVATSGCGGLYSTAAQYTFHHNV